MAWHLDRYLDEHGAVFTAYVTTALLVIGLWELGEWLVGCTYGPR